MALDTNDPAHRELHALSQSTPAPDPTGGSRQTYWFYEKARGSYEETRTLTAKTPVQKQKFDELHPKKQRFDKNLFGKAWNTYLLLPHVVSLGAQKNFVRFNDWLKEQKDEDWAAFYKKTVALVMLWNRTESLVRRQGFIGYRHNIVTYTLAWLFHLTKHRIDLDRIWDKQVVEPSILEAAEVLCQVVDGHIRATERNVTEWCKKEQCWNSLLLLGEQGRLPQGIEETYLSDSARPSYDSSLELEKEAVDFCTSIKADHWFALSKWLKQRSFLSSTARSQCFNMGKCLANGKTPSARLSIPCRKAWNDALQRGWESDNAD